MAEMPDAAARIAAGQPTPLSFCPIDPEAMTLAQDLVQQLAAAAPGKYLHIGGDETLDIGHGRSAGRDFSAVYGDYFAIAAQSVCAAGKTPMLWADMALSHLKVLDALPAETIWCAWGYEAEVPYDQWSTALQGRQWWACPGTSCWRSLWGRTAARDGSIAAALQAHRRFGATGLLQTAWGDHGHLQVWPLTAWGIAVAGWAAWHGALPDAQQRQALSGQVFGDEHLGPWLDELGQLEDDIFVRCWPTIAASVSARACPQ